jgi:peptidoglycan/LPS O-acetylase OafA/YrhL
MPFQTVKNQDIERLRAVAVVAVFLQHVDNLTPIAPGYGLIFNHITFWTGVDLFFAVSGFVVARSLLDSFDTGITKWQILKAFFARRFFRLIPSAWLWLAITLVLYSFVIKSVPNAEPRTVLNGVIAAVLNISNLFWYYCDPTAPTAPNICPTGNTVGVYWSLSLEEQFYVVLALAACLFPLKRLIPVFALMIVAQFFLPRPPYSLAWSLRTDAFFLGVIICLFRRTVYAKTFDSLLSRIGPTGAIVVMAVGLSAMIFGPVQIPAFGCGIAAIGSGLLVLVASSNFDLVPGGRLIAWIGSRSYAIYLIHFVVFALIREGLMRVGLFTQETDWLTFIVLAVLALAATILVAQVNLVAVERPFRRLGYRVSDRILRRQASVRSALIPTLSLSYRPLPSRVARRT